MLVDLDPSHHVSTGSCETDKVKTCFRYDHAYGTIAQQYQIYVKLFDIVYRSAY